MYFLQLFLLLFTSVSNTLSYLSSTDLVDIKAHDHRLLTKILAARQLQDLFDNDKNTHGLFHAHLNQKVYLIIDLRGLYQVSSVEITSDQPENLKQTISVGYGFDKNTTSLFGSLYNCTYQQTSTLCIPACSEYDNSRAGFVGNSLLWSFQSDKEGWTRIYDLIIRGTPFDEKRNMKNNLDDITLFKPYVDHLVPVESMESCSGLLWHLNDESNVTESSALVATDDRNVTIYFGKTYSVTSVHFVTSKQDDLPHEYTLHFSGMESLTKIINLQNDCTSTASSGNDGANFKEYNCPTTDLESYTFDYVTVNVKGLYKLHVYGLPFHYPKIQIIPSKEDDKTIMVDKNMLQISCIAQSCNSASNVLLDADDSYRRSRSSDTSSCPMNGHIIRCEYLNLFRLSTSSSSNNDNNNQKIQLTNQGIINTEFSEIMAELKIIQSNAEKLVVTMPRNAGLSLTVEGIHHNYETQETELDVAVHIASDVISDNVACRPTYLLLEFIEPKIETLKSRVSSKQTIFRIKLPSNQKQINLEMQLSIGSADPTQSEATTNQSISFKNPFYIPTDITVDAENQLIEWFGLPIIFSNLLHHYETKLSGLPKACEQGSEFNLPITQQEIDNGTIYRVNLKNIPDQTITKNGLAIDYTFKVTPVFKGIDGKSITMGTSSDIKFSIGRMGQTDLKAPTSGRYYSLQVQVRPSQMPSCLNLETLNTQFTLRVIGEVDEYPDYIKQVNYVPITMKTTETLSDKNNHVKLYKIENLLPGRRYELQAEVIYAEDFRDKISEPVRLWIEDEVHVQTEEVFISPGERVVINCTGSVGPNDTSQKNLEWKLFDGGRLPDGSRSLKTQEAQSGPLWYAMESLIFDPVNKQHGGVYACFIRPSISELMNKPAILHKVTVTVSDLEINTNSKIVEFGEKVIITCRTASPGQLDWMLPSGEKIEITNEMKSDDDNDDQPYTIKDENDDVKLSIKLIIPKVNLNKVGKYTCLHSPSNNKQTFNLKMKEVINLIKSPESSDKPGKTLILDCTANLGDLHQSVVWYKRPSSNSPWLEITEAIQTIEHITIQQKNPEETSSSGVWLSELKVKNSPGIIGEFMCAIQNIQTAMNIDRMETGSVMTNDFSKITHATIKISLKSVLKILTPIKLENGQINVHCQGYPAHSKDRLQWVYIPLNTDNNPDKVITIVHSNPKDEENEHETDGNTKSLEGKEIDEIVSLAFQLTDSIPATWPGSTGPQQLVQSELIEQEHQPKQMYTAERLSLTFDSKYAENVAGGILSCRYIRPKGILPMDSDEAAESITKVTIPQTNDDDDEIIEKSEIPMKELLDAKQGDDNDNLSILKSSLDEEPDDLQSDDNRNNTEKKSISMLLYMNLVALLIIFMRN
ncbi:unnamed protein product [Schistosoma bovis]|nr:unnamed protein product [Schistosoma bovis]